jgi:AraC family transcriptional regulator
MNAVAKAIWFIETHFSGNISLDDIARAGGVSRYHVVRAFGFATGHSVMRYVRGRHRGRRDLWRAARPISCRWHSTLVMALMRIPAGLS